MNYDPSKSLLLQLRDAAKVERDTLIKFKMKAVADDLDTAIRAFRECPSNVALMAVNGLWSRGIRELGFANPTLPKGGGTQLVEQAA